MVATRFIFRPDSAEFPSASFPELRTVHSTMRRKVLAFDASDNERCFWTTAAPDDWDTTTAPSAVAAFVMASATSGCADFEVSVEAVTDGDALDLDSACGFDAANALDDVAVPGTAGYVKTASLVLTNHDGSAPGDQLTFMFERSATTDGAAGDLYLLWLEVRDAA